MRIGICLPSHVGTRAAVFGRPFTQYSDMTFEDAAPEASGLGMPVWFWLALADNFLVKDDKHPLRKKGLTKSRSRYMTFEQV